MGGAGWQCLLIERYQHAVHGLVLRIFLGLVDQFGEGLTEFSGLRGAEAQVAQGQVGFGG